MPASTRPHHPVDTVSSASARFLVEVAAWILGPMAAFEVLGWPGAVATAVVLIAVPAVCNTPGDKQVTGLATPGPVRIAIEALLVVVAIGAAWRVLGPTFAIVVTLGAVAAAGLQWRRWRWLAGRGASAPGAG